MSTHPPGRPHNGQDAAQSARAGAGSRVEQTRRALAAMLIPLFFVSVFALCIIGTYHQPHPHDIKIGVEGHRRADRALRAAIEQNTGSPRVQACSGHHDPGDTADGRRRASRSGRGPDRHRRVHVHGGVHDLRLPRRHPALHGRAELFVRAGATR